MKHLQKLGGIAALYQAAAYLVAIVYFLFVIDYSSAVEPGQRVAMLVDNQVGIYLTTLLSYVVFGISLIVLVLALFERLKTGAPNITLVATAVGLIWAGAVIASGMIYNMGMNTIVELYHENPAQAVAAWLPIEAVSEGLGGGNGEVLGGLWTLLVSWAALRTGALPRLLSFLGVAVGAVGIISVIPVLNDLTGVFGISQLVWFVWLGIVMLRSPVHAAVA